MDVIKKRKDGSRLVQVAFHDDDGKPLYEIKTKQCFAEECDINNIVNRFRRTGVLPPPPPDSLHYGDFSEIGTFQDAMIKVYEAQDMFMSLPAKIRSKFNNDPGEFLDFVDDPANFDELVNMGLVDPKVSVKPEGDSKSVENVEKSEQ